MFVRAVGSSLRSSRATPRALGNIVRPGPARAGAATPVLAARRDFGSTSARWNSKATRACPKCGVAIPLPASPCPACGELVSIPSGLSLHSLLGVSEPVSKNGEFDIQSELSSLPALGYDLDPRALRGQMLKRQGALHPDRHNQHDMAAGLSSQVNKAYETLASPLRRAEYILRQYGLDTAETDGVDNDGLLMEILEAREDLEDAEGEEEIEKLREHNKAKMNGVIDRLKEAFSKQPPDLEAAKALTVELKYWVGLEEAAKDKF